MGEFLRFGDVYKRQENSIDKLAEIGGTIPYELSCAVSKRVPRVYRRSGEVVGRELLLRF